MIQYCIHVQVHKRGATSTLNPPNRRRLGAAHQQRASGAQLLEDILVGSSAVGELDPNAAACFSIVDTC
jgi:hypothetical protein